MVKRNPVPGFSCSMDGCLNPGVCVFWGLGGVGYHYCLDHVREALLFHERHRLPDKEAL